jgi:transcription-repair coupling factor (superfamily II helicase)
VPPTSATETAGEGAGTRAALTPGDLASLGAAAEIAAALQSQRSLAVGGLWGSSQALLLAALTRAEGAPRGPIVAVLATDAEAESFAADLATFGLEVALFPSREAGAGRRPAEVDLESLRLRLQVARSLSGPPAQRPRAIVASLLSLLQPIPEPRELERARLELRRGQHLEPEALLRRLVEAGFARQPLVERPGEVSLRGDILDIFPFAAERPVRVELLDREVESLRTFDPELQRSIESLERATLDLVADAGGVEDGSGVQPTSIFPHSALFVEIEPLRIEDRAQGLRIRSGSHQRALLQLQQAIDARRALQLQSLPAGPHDLDTRSVQALSAGIRQAPALLAEAVATGTRAIVLCRNEAERHRFQGLLEESGIPGLERVETRIGTVAKGFRLPALGLIVVNHRELAGVVGARRTQPARIVHKTRALQSFFELKPGDHVVHAVHGLALYRGLERMARGGGEEEHLHLFFDGDVSLFVPATRIDLVQRYIGSGGAAPALDRIGGATFRRRREKVERALFDLAAELLEVQAQRELKKRGPWLGDEELERDLVGSFPYADTPDQAQVDREIREDLRGARPMDRLLCGDVGFGKTELAVRAAFRVASAGGQVAVLVPTTVLAHQHLATFRERLSDFPVEVEALSRTVGGRREQTIVERVAAGSVDVLIGTHRILSKDVRFRSLGLVIIDEEQRFGVAHKEHFKALRASVDVLTLSATPIPRTLHMSLSGVRDISALSTPPPGRQEIETRLVDAADDALIREAILREKNRGGQVFFLHNRVQSIAALARRLMALVPECSFAVGHGQMGARELERIMDDFAGGDVDVLVATTIVENGLDIPAAGTIFIDEAQRYGLSELHQLRGRVGRGQHKAWCYLLVDPLAPLREVARERLKALEEMNQLGAGFAISMKDLEIRGAGNILGVQQSGHIAAVGYDMYCRLLKQTIERMRAGLGPDRAATEAELDRGVELELGLRAFLPEGWIPEQDARLGILRALDAVHSDEAAEEAEAMLRDRFGRLPQEALLLVRSFRLRERAAVLGLRRVSWRGDAYLVEFDDRVALEQLAGGARAELRPLRTGLAQLMVPSHVRSPEQGLEWLERVLKEAAGTATIAAPDLGP